MDGRQYELAAADFQASARIDPERAALQGGPVRLSPGGIGVPHRGSTLRWFG